MLPLRYSIQAHCQVAHIRPTNQNLPISLPAPSHKKNCTFKKMKEEERPVANNG